MFVCVKQIRNGPLSTTQHTTKCNSHQLQLQIPEADIQPALCVHSFCLVQNLLLKPIESSEKKGIYDIHE